MLSEKTWNNSQEVLKGLHQALLLSYCRRWMVWDRYITILLEKTKAHCDGPEESNLILKNRWIALMGRNHTAWLSLLHSAPIMAEGVDEEDLEEHRFPVDDDDEGYRGNLFDIMNDVGLEWIAV